MSSAEEKPALCSTSGSYVVFWCLFYSGWSESWDGLIFSTSGFMSKRKGKKPAREKEENPNIASNDFLQTTSLSE